MPEEIKVSEAVQRMTRRIINGLEIKYDPEFHIPLLLQTYSEGHGEAGYCAAAEIALSTFHKWRADHPEFKKAWEQAVQLSEMWWTAQFREAGLHETDGVKFNQKGWAMIMKNRFGYTDTRKLKLAGLKDAKNFNEQIKSISDAVADGELTSGETQQLSNLILAAVKVDEHTELKSKVEKLEKIAEEQSAGR